MGLINLSWMSIHSKLKRMCSREMMLESVNSNSGHTMFNVPSFAVFNFSV